MNDLPISDLLVATTSGGLSIGVGIYAAREMGRGIRWLIEFFTGRQDKRQEHIDSVTKELIEALRVEIGGLRERVAAAEKSLLECQKRHSESEAKVVRLEAMLAGFGDARQHAQLIVSEEKRKEAMK